jgi:hypothetical protein
MQYRIQHKIKQDPLPDRIKVPRKSPMSARNPKANAAHDLDTIHEETNLAFTDPGVPIDPGTDRYDLTHSQFEDTIEIDTS